MSRTKEQIQANCKILKRDHHGELFEEIEADTHEESLLRFLENEV